MLSSRQKMLLRKLLEGSQYVTIEFLSKWQNVSARTNYYDLDAIASFIWEVGVTFESGRKRDMLAYWRKKTV